MYTNKGAMANLQEQKVQEWTADYITALNDNFYNHQVDSYQRMVREGKYTDHALDQLRNIKTRDARYLYTWKALEGRKFFKLYTRHLMKTRTDSEMVQYTASSTRKLARYTKQHHGRTLPNMSDMT